MTFYTILPWLSVGIFVIGFLAFLKVILPKIPRRIIIWIPESGNEKERTED